MLKEVDRVMDRRTAAIGTGVLLVLVGLLLVWGGLTPLSQNRDADGYLMSDPLTIDRRSHAVVTNDVGLLRGHYDCAAEETFLLAFSTPDEVRMRGAASGSGGLFMGIAPVDAVEEYLEGIAHDEITDWDCDVDDIAPVEYTMREGTEVPAPPGSEQFWVRSASGDGEQALDWTIESGDWAVVIMNADASSGVSADVSFGALAPSNLSRLAWILFAVGLVALIGGGWLMYRSIRSGQNATPVGAGS